MRKALNIIFPVIVFILMQFLFISFSLEKAIETTITNTYTVDKISNYIINYIEKEFKDLTNSELNILKTKLKNNQEFNNITKKYVNGILESILQNRYIEVDISNEINSIIEKTFENKRLNEELNKKIDEINLNNMYEYIYDLCNNAIDNKIICIINIYNIIKDNTFRLFIVIVLAFQLLFLFINNACFKDVFKMISKLLIVFGVVNALTLFLINRSMLYITSSIIGNPFIIDLSFSSKISLLILLIGVFFTYIIELYNKIKSKKFN